MLPGTKKLLPPFWVPVTSNAAKRSCPLLVFYHLLFHFLVAAPLFPKFVCLRECVSYREVTTVLLCMLYRDYLTHLLKLVSEVFMKICWVILVLLYISNENKTLHTLHTYTSHLLTNI